MKRVLVTGATGFIGRWTLPRLVAQGYEVHALSRRGGGAAGPPEVRWETLDLLDPATAGELIERISPTHLLHLAWYAEPGKFWHSPENLRWVEASLRLLRAFAAGGGERVLAAGTCAEYEWQARVRCLEDETPCRPATVYGASKHGLHLIAQKFAEREGLSLAWGRIFFVFGPGEHPQRLGGGAARALARGEPAELSHGRQVRDFLYSEDLADAFVAVLDSGVEGAVNLASGQATTIRELVEALALAAGRPDLPRFGARDPAPGEPAALTADVTRLREQVGWTPPASLQERARDTIAWWRTQLTGDDQRQGPA
ncbi:MAG TPA: NAD(P)-dependent oxidoreductase [Solirubrobacteraceae bacterium]|nr:NAD(P)-dependent oxidoreductase [Solirubrobacteraceae bacterium]